MPTDLPTNIDATYADRDAGDALHQQNHDVLHALRNKLEGVDTSDGTALLAALLDGVAMAVTVEDADESYTRPTVKFVAGSNVTVEIADVGGKVEVTIGSTGGGGSLTDEQLQDIIGPFLTDSSVIDFTYDDAGNAVSATIKAGVVTLAMLADLAQSTIIGRAAGAGAGVPTALTATQVKAILAIANTDVSGLGTASTHPASDFDAAGAAAAAASGAASALAAHEADTTSIHGIADTGALVVSSDSRLSDTRTPTDNTVTTAKVVDDAVTNAKAANMAQSTVKGRASGAGTGDPTDLTAAQVKTILAIASGDVSGLGGAATLNVGTTAGTVAAGDDARLSDTRTPTDNTVSTAKLQASAVTNAKAADMAQGTVKGRADGAGTGAPIDLTPAELKAILLIAGIDPTDITTFDAYVRQSRLDQMNGIGADLNFGGHKATGLADGSGSTDAATFGQLSALLTGQTWKQPVAAIAASNITLSGTQTIDGVAVVAGDRVLATNQSNHKDDGIYVVAAGAWSRAADADATAELANATVISLGGTVGKGDIYTQTATVTTVGTTAQSWVKTGEGNAVYTADGVTIQLVGNQFSLVGDPVLKSVVTTANDFIVGTGAATVARKTPAQVKAILAIAGGDVSVDSSAFTFLPTSSTEVQGFAADVDSNMFDLNGAISDLGVSLITYAAPLASPVFTGDPTVPAGDPVGINSIPRKKYVDDAVALLVPKSTVTTANDFIVGTGAGAVTRKTPAQVKTILAIASGDVSGLGGAATLNVGTAAGTVAAGDDARLSDTRTPTDNTVSTAKLQANAVTNAKLAQMAQARIKGTTAAGGTTDPVDLTPAQVRAIIGVPVLGYYGSQTAITTATTPAIGTGGSLLSGGTTTVPVCAVGDVLEYEFAGTLVQNAGSTRIWTFNVKLGGTSIACLVSFTDSATTRAWRLRARCVLTATNAQTWSIELLASVTTGSAGTVNVGDPTQTSAIDLTAASTADLTVSSTNNLGTQTCQVTSGTVRKIAAS